MPSSSRLARPRSHGGRDTPFAHLGACLGRRQAIQLSSAEFEPFFTPTWLPWAGFRYNSSRTLICGRRGGTVVLPESHQAQARRDSADEWEDEKP